MNSSADGTGQCLDEFSTADKLPCVLKVLAVDGSRAAMELKSGSEVVMLATQEAEFVRLLDEETGEEYTECDLDSLDLRFSLLGEEAALDRHKFESVGDIMKLEENVRPKYVRATQGWVGEFHFKDPANASHTGNVDVNEVFYVGSSISQQPNGTVYVKWETVELSMERPCTANNPFVTLRPAYLPLNVECGFTTQVDPGDFTLKQIAAAYRKQLITVPLRMQVTASTVATCKVLKKLRIQRMDKDTTLIGMKMAEPSGVITSGKTFFRISSSDARYIRVKEESDWRSAMRKLVQKLLCDDDVTKAGMVRRSSHLSKVDAPPLPPRISGDDGDGGQQRGTLNRPTNPTSVIVAKCPPLSSPYEEVLPTPLVDKDKNIPYGRSCSTGSDTASDYCQLFHAGPRPSVTRRTPETTSEDADPAYLSLPASSASPLEQTAATAATAAEASPKPKPNRLPMPRHKDQPGVYVDLAKNPVAHQAGGMTARQRSATLPRARHNAAEDPLTYEDIGDYLAERSVSVSAKPIVPPRDQSPAPTPTGGPRPVRPKPRARQQLLAAASVCEIPDMPQPAMCLLTTVELIDRLRESNLSNYERAVRERNLDGEQFCQLDNEALTQQLGVSSEADLKAMLSMM